jgi:hypothetical protein
MTHTRIVVLLGVTSACFCGDLAAQMSPRDSGAGTAPNVVVTMLNSRYTDVPQPIEDAKVWLLSSAEPAIPRLAALCEVAREKAENLDRLEQAERALGMPANAPPSRANMAATMVVADAELNRKLLLNGLRSKSVGSVVTDKAGVASMRVSPGEYWLIAETDDRGTFASYPINYFWMASLTVPRVETARVTLQTLRRGPFSASVCESRAIRPRARR